MHSFPVSGSKMLLQLHNRPWARLWTPAAFVGLLILPHHGYSFVSSSSWSAKLKTETSHHAKKAFTTGLKVSSDCAEAERAAEEQLANPPAAITVIPGVDTTEEQPVRNPIDSSSHVLVVGGSRGIGLEFVKQCARRGGKVVATHRDTLVGGKLEELSLDDSLRVETLEMDVADASSIASAAVELRSRDSFEPLTHIIHNAGTYLQGMSFDGTARGGRKEQPVVTAHDMMESFRVNAVGPLLVAQSFVPLMGRSAERPAKDIPVFSILSSKVGSVYDNSSGGTYAYRASKSALNNIAKSMSVDLAGEVSVVLLHPGFVRTDMTSGNGLIDVDESVVGMLRAVEATDARVGFRFVDYKACLIPW